MDSKKSQTSRWMDVKTVLQIAQDSNNISNFTLDVKLEQAAA
jgi:hypothetical protein